MPDARRINLSVDTTGFSASTITKVSDALKTWQNGAENLWVVNARYNIWKRDASKALMAGQLSDGTKLLGEDAYKKALIYHNFKPVEANKVVKKVKNAFQELNTIANGMSGDEKKLMKRFITTAKGKYQMNLVS